MTKITAELANAARRLLAVRTERGDHFTNKQSDIGTECWALERAVDAFDAQQLQFAEFSTRLPDEKLREVLAEESKTRGAPKSILDSLANRWHEIDSELTPEQSAAVAAMRRIADYADHLRKLITLLASNADLSALIYQVRDDEMQGWEGPRVLAVGEAVAGMLAEVKVSAIPKQKAGIDATKNCAVLRGDEQRAAEKACTEPWTTNDGVAYCDTCGLFRASVRI